MEPIEGEMYSRREIAAMVGGGSLQAYLPENNGIVLCGCFSRQINAYAPERIDVGRGPIIERSAKRLVEQGTPIPVFLKQRVNEWKYVGMYRPVAYDEGSELQTRYPEFRGDAVGALELVRA